MKRRHGSQEKRLVNGCVEKHGYDTEALAFQKGQLSYYCIFCGKWHRASIHANDSPHALRQTIIRLQSQLTAFQEAYEALDAQNGFLHGENEALHSDVNRCRHEIIFLRQLQKRTIDARIRRFIIRVKQCTSKWRPR